MDNLLEPFAILARQINLLFANKEPWQIATITATTVLTSVWFWEYVNQDESELKIIYQFDRFSLLDFILFEIPIAGVAQRTKKQFFRLIRFIPVIQRKIDSELETISKSMEDSVRKRTENMDYYISLPNYGLTEEEILKAVDEYLALGEYKWKEGRVSGAVYNFNDNLCKLVGSVYEKTSYTNPLHSDIFPGINKMEAEVVRMCATMFNGDEETCGTVKNFYNFDIFNTTFIYYSCVICIVISM